MGRRAGWNAAHSPNLLAYPSACIYLFSDDGISDVKYTQTEHYQITRDYLVAGGSFTHAGGLPAARIARWNGAQWEALGGGMDGGEVSRVALNGTEVYAAGTFNTADGQSANHIAWWHGGHWETLGMTSDGLYVSGTFSLAR